MSPPTHVDLTSAQRGALVATVVTGFVSGISAFALLLFLLYHVLRMLRRGDKIYPITLFYLLLLFWDTIQGIGWIVSIQWVLRGQVKMGAFCVSQATIQQLGATGTALSIVAMAYTILHDYVIDSAEPLPRWAGPLGVAIISAVQAFDISLPNGIFHGANSYYGIAGFWCWISDDHYITKIVTEYMWYWLAGVSSFLMAVFYCCSIYKYGGERLPAGFCWIGFPMQGNKLLRIGLISFDSNTHGRPIWSFSLDIVIPRRTISIMLPIPIQIFDHYQMEPIDQSDKNFAVRLLLFPLSYLVLIAPLSIVRFIEFGNFKVGSGAIIFSASFFALTGFVDFLLFIWAGPAFGINMSNDE